jgi:hypothetical protein
VIPGAPDPDPDGWNYSAHPLPETDARNLLESTEKVLAEIGAKAGDD